jgi:hypothetical protein
MGIARLESELLEDDTKLLSVHVLDDAMTSGPQPPGRDRDPSASDSLAHELTQFIS